MVRILRITVLVLLALSYRLSYSQTQLAAWTFDNTPAAPNTPTSITANLGAQSGTAALYADGTNGSSAWTSATELAAFAGTTTNDPRGSGGANTFTLSLVGNAANNKAVVLKLSTAGYENLTLTYATRNTSTGFTSQAWSWSTDGANFTPLRTVTGLTTTFAAQSLDFSAISSINNTSSVYLKVTFSGATNSSGNNRIDNIVITATPTTVPTPPAFTANYPRADNITLTGFNGVVNLDKTGTAYLVVLADGEPAPSSAQVKAGQDGTGAALAANLKASVTVSTAASDFTLPITGLTSATDYDVYFVAENANGIQTSPSGIDLFTLDPSDILPPDFIASYPIVNSITPSTFTVRTNINEVGRTYFVVLPGGATVPTSAQIKSGQNAAGTSLATNRAGVINSTALNTEFTSVVNGLSANTTYDIYFVTEDNIPNLQSSPVKVTATTPTLYAELFNDCNGTASFTSYSIAGDQVWGCVDFGYNSTKAIRMNGFASAAVANEDWLISPPMNLSTGAALSFYSQFSFAGNGLQLKVSLDYSGAGNPNDATWTDLNGNFPTVSVGSTSTALTDWTLSNVDLSAYANKKVYLAFVYTSTATAAARWTLDEINVSHAEASYLSVSPAGLQFSTAGSKKSYTLKGVHLTSTVSITAPSDFQISKDNSSFSSSLSFTASEANASPLVYVQFTGTGVQNYSGTITHTSTGVSGKTVSVTAVDKSKSFNISAYNLEFFGSNVADGSSEYGPVDDALQVSNVTTVMQTIGSDIFSVEEVSDDAAMDQLVSNLPGYAKLMADRWSYSFNPPDPTFPPQKIGIVYKTSTVQVVSSRVMFSKFYDDIRAAEATSVSAALALLPNYPSSGGNTPSNFWSSGRLPFMVTADVTVNSVKKRIKVVVLHSKSGSAQADYDRRKYDVKVLYDSLMAHNAHDNLIILGDFNDNVLGSINTGSASTYQVFVDDVANFNALTYPLAQNGGYSFPSSSSFLDHIIISNELNSDYIANSTVVEDPRTYIPSYTTTTSDHLPVSARFALSKVSQTITFTAPVAKTLGSAPFALSATSTSGLPVSFTTTSDKVTLSGSQVTLVKAGSVTINASQSGDESYSAAPVVEQSFCINPAKPAITLSNGNTESPVLTSSASAGNQWYLNGTAITGATNATYTATTPGVYSVQVKADNCASEFSANTSILITALAPESSGKISVYPNPVEDYLMVSGLTGNDFESSLTDMTGRTFSIRLEKQNDVHTADVKSLTSGLYIARIRQGNGVQQIKFIKK